jgi:hypothetical protein
LGPVNANVNIQTKAEFIVQLQYFYCPSSNGLDKRANLLEEGYLNLFP